ncbi:MAG: arginine repressor [Epulopiscium sp. Nele67-Bin005]|nr:MAG: arginine repressor [Epulopiscium sp. Nele67-Bin005]
MKEQRQSQILNLIREFDIETQEDLAERLEKDGFKVTQATISRDIRELKLTKMPNKENIQKYVAVVNSEPELSEKVINVFKAGFMSVNKAQNILVVKTLPGMGSAVGSAIDAFGYAEIVGTLAGDDTVFCAMRQNEHMDDVIRRFDEVLNS